MSLTELIPADVRLRWVKILLVAAGLYVLLYVLGVQKFLRDDAEGIASRSGSFAAGEVTRNRNGNSKPKPFRPAKLS